jgi:hypothetical protein
VEKLARREDVKFRAVDRLKGFPQTAFLNFGLG